MDINKKNLIQVLEEQNNPGYEDDEQENNNKERDFEEEFDDNNKKDHKMGKTQAKLARREAQKDIAKGRSTDLLRLEKNYFDGIYHEDNYQGMNEFVVKKLDGKSEIQKQKPLIGFYDKSDVLGKIKSFLPQFANDTKDLANDATRKEKMNLDVIDEPTGDEKVIEMNLLMGIFDVNKKEQNQPKKR